MGNLSRSAERRENYLVANLSPACAEPTGMTEDPEPSQDPDSIEVLTAVDRATLKKLTRFHTGAELSGLLLRAHNRVGRYLLGERDLPQREKMVVLQAAGISPWLYHELLRSELPEPSPAEILRQLCRDPNHVCADPFLIELEQALEGIRRKPIVDGPGFEGFAEELAEIEELRHVSSAMAREQLNGLLLKMTVTAAKEQVTRDLRGQIALSIGVWAGISWLERNYDDSAAAYGFAFDLAPLDDVRLLVNLKQRAAHLVADCGFMQYAKVWLKEAIRFYDLAGSAVEQGKALVDLARIEFYSGRISEASSHFERSLTLLPVGATFRYRVAALEALSNCYQDAGKIKEAKDALAQAYAEYGERRDSFRGYLVWVQARLSHQSGEYTIADSLYKEALEILRRYSGPVDAELAALDFAEMRIASQRSTKDIGDLILTWLKEAHYAPKLAQVAAGMVRTLSWQKPNLEDLAALRKLLQQVGGVTMPPRLKTD